jgi:hypothetical protein
VEFFCVKEKAVDFQGFSHPPPVEKPVENVEKYIGRLFEGKLLDNFMLTTGRRIAADNASRTLEVIVTPLGLLDSFLPRSFGVSI